MIRFQPGLWLRAEVILARTLRTTSLICVVGLALIGCRGGAGGLTPIRTAFNKGVYQHSQGNYEAAIAEYREALEEDETDHRARFNLAMALETLADGREQGDSAAASQLREEAEREYRRILDARPDDLRSSVNLAAREYEKGLKAEAFQRLRSTIEEHPDSAAPRVALAAHLFRKAQNDGSSRVSLLEDARALLEAAITRSPTSIEANMLLGDVYFGLGTSAPTTKPGGLFANARQAYRTALERAPSDVATLLEIQVARTWHD